MKYSNYTPVSVVTLDMVDMMLIVDTSRQLAFEENRIMEHAIQSMMAKTMYAEHQLVIEEMPVTMKYFNIPVTNILVYVNTVTFKVTKEFIEKYNEKAVDLSE